MTFEEMKCDFVNNGEWTRKNIQYPVHMPKITHITDGEQITFTII